MTLPKLMLRPREVAWLDQMERDRPEQVRIIRNIYARHAAGEISQADVFDALALVVSEYVDSDGGAQRLRELAVEMRDLIQEAFWGDVASLRIDLREDWGDLSHDLVMEIGEIGYRAALCDDDPGAYPDWEWLE